MSHRMLRLAGEGARLVSDARDGDVLYMWEPLYHIGGSQLIVLPLLRRVILHMVQRFSAGRFWAEVSAAGATHIHFLGGILQILLKQPPSALDRATAPGSPGAAAARRRCGGRSRTVSACRCGNATA